MNRFLLAVVLAVLCPKAGLAAEIGSGADAIAAPLGTAISYQGKLDKNGAPVNGNCNFVFKLFNAATGPAQVGSTVTLSNQPVNAGLFTTSLDFGPGSFDGQARWLEIQIQGPGDAGFTTLTPRQPVTPAPYALFALNNATGLTLPYSGSTSSAGSHGFRVDNTTSSGTGATALLGTGSAAVGVWGTSSTNAGVYGQSSSSAGVWGQSTTNSGVYGQSNSSAGVWGKCLSGCSGVYGESPTRGVFGESTPGIGVWGKSQSSAGIYGESNTSAGVWGKCMSGCSGVYGESPTRGVFGESATGIGVWGRTASASSMGGYFENTAGGTALYADGLAKVKILQITGGADLAERFPTSEPAEPGTVMVIDPESPGRMRIATEAYCHRVAGIVSGAESLPAGVVLGMAPAHEDELPLALSGRVWVRGDASQAPIHPGDLLTTSGRPGHAMAATDTGRSAGAILGKAMSSLEAGTGMVLVLVSLQ